MAGLFLLALRVVLFAAVVDGVEFFSAFDLVLVLVIAGGDVFLDRLRPPKLTLLLSADLVLDLGAAQYRTR